MYVLRLADNQGLGNEGMSSRGGGEIIRLLWGVGFILGLKKEKRRVEALLHILMII